MEIKAVTVNSNNPVAIRHTVYCEWMNGSVFRLQIALDCSHRDVARNVYDRKIEFRILLYFYSPITDQRFAFGEVCILITPESLIGVHILQYSRKAIEHLLIKIGDPLTFASRKHTFG